MRLRRVALIRAAALAGLGIRVCWLRGIRTFRTLHIVQLEWDAGLRWCIASARLKKQV
jgi:hypothetical protein